ncbi:MAG: aspartate/glutamate racemase family protein [Bacteroidales bacterium]
MKTLGIIGGMSWESTAIYYDLINREVRRRTRDGHTAPIWLYSFDWAEIEEMVDTEDHQGLRSRFATLGKELEGLGAGVILLAANTAHKWAGLLEETVQVPIIHIADALGLQLAGEGVERVFMLGTKFTMQEDFLKEMLYAKYGIDTVVPDDNDIERVHRIIYYELVKGEVSDISRKYLLDLIEKNSQVDAVLLACTELSMIIHPGDAVIPVFDSTRIHAMAAVDAILKD